MCSDEGQLVLMDLQGLASHIKTGEASDSKKKEVRREAPHVGSRQGLCSFGRGLARER